jgi:hypothetical protein
MVKIYTFFRSEKESQSVKYETMAFWFEFLEIRDVLITKWTNWNVLNCKLGNETA